MLPGCAHRSISAGTTPVAVTLTDRPPSELLACPVAPAGVPRTVAADIPAPARAALIRLALAYRAAVDQLTRLITWHDPGACPSFSPPAATKVASAPAEGSGVGSSPRNLLPPGVK